MMARGPARRPLHGREERRVLSPDSGRQQEMPKKRYRFDEDYREEAELSDGSRVLLRVLRPEDRPLLVRGFQRLSAESRYLRFMGSKAELSEEELESLLTLDGDDRFAIGAVGTDPRSGEPEGLGVARFARLPDDPEVAEAAVTVVDEAQGRGLGSLLLRRLAAAARERGVRRFRGDILSCNEPMRRLLASRVDVTVSEPEHGVVRVLVELPSFSTLMAEPDHGELLGRLLAQAAGGRLTVRLGSLLLKRR